MSSVIICGGSLQLAPLGARQWEINCSYKLNYLAQHTLYIFNQRGYLGGKKCVGYFIGNAA